MPSVAGALASNSTAVALANGVLLPLIGFGCAGMIRRDSLKDAMSLGYQLFDTAQELELHVAHRHCGWPTRLTALAHYSAGNRVVS
eukprot:scaffold201406_cov36-Tisochrysis_lutea.AAC.2